MLMIALGGAAGSVARFLISELVNEKATGAFPWGTLTVNVAGCLVIGLLMGVMGRGAAFCGDCKPLLVTGFCGGFTTFSTFAYDNVQLMTGGNGVTAVLYALTCVVAGIAAAAAGLLLTRL